MFALEVAMGYENIWIALSYRENTEQKSGFDYSISMALDMHSVLRLIIHMFMKLGDALCYFCSAGTTTHLSTEYSFW